ncbi:MAG: LytTR family DNA-binding domain-containing protein [Crocinitomicaceae bacterium]
MKKDVTCIIVDDELQNQVVLEKMIDQFCPTVEVLGSANSVKEAIVLIKKTNPDIVFLDIEMPEENGFQLLEQIENPDFDVIFTTAHAEYALKAIKYAAIDYILKPINLTELKMGIEKVIAKIRSDGGVKNDIRTKVSVLNKNRKENMLDFEKIALPADGGIQMHDLDEIIWCQAQKTQTIFHLKDGQKITVSNVLKEYESLLPSSQFFRAHKSHLVNLKEVEKYIGGQGGILIMSNGDELEVAVRRKKELIDILKTKK